MATEASGSILAAGNGEQVKEDLGEHAACHRNANVPAYARAVTNELRDLYPNRFGPILKPQILELLLGVMPVEWPQWQRQIQADDNLAAVIVFLLQSNCLLGVTGSTFNIGKAVFDLASPLLLTTTTAGATSNKRRPVGAPLQDEVTQWREFCTGRTEPRAEMFEAYRKQYPNDKRVQQLTIKTFKSRFKNRS